jgi:hypothetical protein
VNGLGRTVSKQAMYELKSARSRDEAACSAVFEALEIHGNKHRKLRAKILKAYSNVVSGGTGHIKQLYEEWEVERNSREYMKRTFCCLDPGSSRFTAPMFVLCLWNFMTLENGGLRGPPVKKAEWIGRAYFGGNRCDPTFEASQDEVFRLMDAAMGLSKDFDYNPRSENNRDMKVFVGNSKEYDVKKAKTIMKAHIKKGKTTLDAEDFCRLGCKLQGILKFSGQQHLVKLKVGGDKLWRNLQAKRKTCGQFDEIVEVLRREAPQVLKAKTGGTKYAVEEEKAPKAKPLGAPSQNKKYQNSYSAGRKQGQPGKGRKPGPGGKKRAAARKG